MMNSILEAIHISYRLPVLEKLAEDAEGLVEEFEQAKLLMAIASYPDSYRELTVEEGREIALAVLERYDAMPYSLHAEIPLIR